MSFIELLISSILSIIFDSLVVLAFVHFFLSLFRIRDSNIRILFFFLPLIKPLFVITERVSLNRHMLDNQVVHSGFRLPDPNNIFGLRDFTSGLSPISFSEMDATILVIVVSSILAAVIVRWVHLGLFYRSVAYEERVTRKQVPFLFSIIDDFSKKLNIRPPYVSLTCNRYFSPFLIGIRNKTLVISPSLLDVLNKSEKETLVRHELSHIKRGDNIISWAALILRDLTFFNPVAHLSYYLIRSEQERAADNLVLLNTEKDKKEIAKNILNSILKYKDIISSKKIPSQCSAFNPFKLIGNRRLQNRINSILKFRPEKVNIRLFPRILMYILFLILFLIQVVLFVRIGDMVLFLR